jgi:hypothetical protein
MNLQNIVCDAGAGFAIGLTWGLKNPNYKLERTLEFIEAVPEEKRTEIGITKEISPEVVTYIKNRVFSSSVAIPYLLGGVYSFVASVASQTPFSENLVATVPCAYLGNFVGRGIRLFKDRKERKMIKTLKQVLEDPDNAEKYVLSEEQRQRIDNDLEVIEKGILEGKEDPSNFIEQVSRMYHTLTENPGPYTQIVLGRNTKIVEKVIKRAFLQRKVSEFYEKSYAEGCPEHFKKIFDDLANSPEAIQVLSLGKPKEPKLEVFSKEGNEFYVQRFEWPDMKIIRRDGMPGFSIQINRNNSSTGQIDTFAGDYRAIAERIIGSESEGYSTMLLT